MIEPLYNDNCKTEDIEFFNLTPQYDYVGFEDIGPLEVDGKEIFLEQNELNLRSVYSSGGVQVVYANDKLINLYDDALSDTTGRRKGILVLDCSCPRVKAKGNIFEKAESVQKLYKQKGIKVIVITTSGGGISVKYPRKEWKWCTLLMSEVLDLIDKKFGLGMPVIIFGYSKMRRSFSFRSLGRVPT